MSTLGEDLPKEMERVRNLIPMYAEIGPSGAFAIAMMNAALGKAENAMITGDLPGMIAAYKELKEFHE